MPLHTLHGMAFMFFLFFFSQTHSQSGVVTLLADVLSISERFRANYYFQVSLCFISDIIPTLFFSFEGFVYK